MLCKNGSLSYESSSAKIGEKTFSEEASTVAGAIKKLKTSLNAAYEAEEKLKVLLTDSRLIRSEQVSPQRSPRAQRTMSDVLSNRSRPSDLKGYSKS